MVGHHITISQRPIRGCADASGQLLLILKCCSAGLISYLGRRNGSELSGITFLRGTITPGGRRKPTWSHQRYSECSIYRFENHLLLLITTYVTTAGGSNTINITLQTFVLAMLCFPDVQVKAQEELDRVIGRDRLPDFNDESDLPYLGALLKEVYR